MTRKRRNKVLKAAKGYWGSKSKHFKMAKQAVMKSGNYAYIGSINDEILTKSELALKFIDFLKINYCNALTDRYNIDIDIQNSENFEILKQIAVARLCLLKGNEPDLDKAAAILFDDFRSGRLGRMTLEEIPE